MIGRADQVQAVGNDAVVDLLLWSRFFSPLVDDVGRVQIFSALELGDFSALADSYWGTFHIGAPQAPATVMLHAALGLDGGGLREDVVRVMEHLQLDWADSPLPPDHLAAILELLVVSYQQEEPVLVREMLARWLLPWVDKTKKQLVGSPWQQILQRFGDELRREK